MNREVRIPGLRRVMHLGGGGGGVEREIDEELGFHLEMRRDELIAQGLAPVDALRVAREEFGSVSDSRHELVTVDKRRRANARRADWREALAQDTRLALRRMRATPGLTLAIVMTLALGIGTNAAMFQIADRLLFEPPAQVSHPEQLANVLFETSYPLEHNVDASVRGSYPTLASLESSPSIGGLAMHDPEHLSVGLGQSAWRAPAELVSTNYFTVLGARPELGRLFSPAADSGAAAPGVVISDRLWRERLGQDPGVIGMRIRIAKSSYPIVGVAPAGFTGAGIEAVDVWLPASEAPAVGVVPKDWRSPNSFWLSAVVRVKPAAPRDLTVAQLTTLYRHWRAMDPANPFADQGPDTISTVKLVPLSGLREDDSGRSPQAEVAAWLAVLSVLVLLIACANVAGLLLVRSMRRSREFALRQALGMSRARLIGQLLVESAILAILGAIAAIIALHWTTPPLRDLVAPRVLWTGLSLRSDLLLGATTLVGVLIMALASSLLPARFLSRTEVSIELKPMGNTAPAGRARAQALLVGAQIAICLVLLAVAGVFVQSLRRVRSLDYGVNLDLIAAELRTSTVPNGGGSTQLDRAVRAVSAIPGVRGVAVTDASPFRSMEGGGIGLPGRPIASLQRLSSGVSYLAHVSPGYFSTTGTAIVRGRGFSPADTLPGAAPVLVISENMARAYWPGGDPLGQCAYVDDSTTCTTIIGVAHDELRMFVTDKPRLQIFLPLVASEAASRNMTLLIRAASPSATVPAVQRAIQQLDPSAPYADIATLRNRLDPQTQSWLLGASMMSGFATLALILAALGLYGIVSFMVASRAHEIGVRVAIGATRANVVALFVRRGLRIAATGVVAGGIASFLVVRRLTDLLFHTSPTDPTAMSVAIVVMLLVAIVASLVPAARAARVDPLEALRAE